MVRNILETQTQTSMHMCQGGLMSGLLLSFQTKWLQRHNQALVFTWESFAGQLSQRPEDVTHECGTARTGLGDGGKDLVDITL